MGEITLVLTDIDGTLVWHGQHNPTTAVKQAMEDVQDAGKKLTAATGRPYEMMSKLFKRLGFQGLGIFDAGATIRDVQTGESVWQNWLEPERLKKIAGLLLTHSTVIDFFPIYKEVPPEETSIDEISDDAPYVFAFIKAESGTLISEQLSEIPNLSFHIGPGIKEMPGLLDIQVTDINSDKFHAVNALRRIVHSDKEETLAIGDSTNDLPLFRNAGLKIAMGNAMPALKTEADYIVGNVDEDGFAEAINRFVLIN